MAHLWSFLPSWMYSTCHVECVHERMRDHKCTMCGNMFNQPNNFKANVEYIHKGRRDHKCAIYKRSFTKQIIQMIYFVKVFSQMAHLWSLLPYVFNMGLEIIWLVKHISTHGTFMIPHECIQHGAHLECIHEERRDHKCTICGKKFYQLNDLKANVECIHKGS